MFNSENLKHHSYVKNFSLTLTSPGAQPSTSELGEDTWILGSGSAPDIFSIEVPGVSFKHARITLREHSLLVEDLDSPNGTYVNGTRIRGSKESSYPVTLQLGEAELRVEATPATPATPAAPSAPSDSERTSRLTQPQSGSTPAPARPPHTDVTGRIARSQTLSGGVPATDATACFTAPELDDRTMAFAMPSDEAPMEDNVPVQMQYALKSEIARGGMGKIFTAQDPHLEREVALKVSTVKDRAEDSHFLREARVLANLAHPNIVPVHHIGADAQGRPFYSMKLVNGRTLQAVIKLLDARDAVTVATYTRQRLLEIFRKVCDAVSFAHAKGYIHRDLKPENVMIGEFGEVLVMDWGLAKVFRRSSNTPEPGADDELGPETVPFIEGTPKYMSPEQAEGMFRGLDQRSDVYSLGGILYAILMHRAPVSGVSLNEVLEKVKKGETTTMTLPRRRNSERDGYKPSHLTESLPDALKAITKKALARDRRDRYQTVDELIADVEAYQSGYATSAEHATLLLQVQLLVKRNPAVSALVAVLLLTAAVFTVRLAASEREAMAQAQRADEQALRAKTNEQEAQAQAKLAKNNEEEAQNQAKRAKKNEEEAQAQARRAQENEQKAQAEKEVSRKATARAQIALAEAAEQNSNADQMRTALESIHEDLRDQSWSYLTQKIHSSIRSIRFPLNNLPASLEFSPTEPGKLFTVSRRALVQKHDLLEDVKPIPTQLNPSIEIDSAAVSADQSLVALGLKQTKKSADVVVCSYQDGAVLAVFERPSEGIKALEFSPDNSLLLIWTQTYSPDPIPHTLQVFELSTGSVLWTRKYPSLVLAGFSKKDGFVKVVTGTQIEFHTLDKRTGEPSGKSTRIDAQVGGDMVANKDFTALFFLTSSSLFKADTASGRVISQSQIFSKTKDKSFLAYLQSLNLLVTLTPVSDRSAVLEAWDEETGSRVKSIPIEMPASTSIGWRLVSHPNQKHVAVLRGDTVNVWSFERPEPAAAFSLPMYAEKSFAFVGGPNQIIRQTDRKKTKTGSLVSDVVKENITTQQSESLELLKDVNFPSCSFSPNRSGKMLALGWWGAREEAPNAVSTYTVEGDQLSKTSQDVPIKPIPGHFSLSPDGEHLWLGNSVCSPLTGRQITPINRAGELISDKLMQGVIPKWMDESHLLEVAMVGTDRVHAEHRLKHRHIVKWNVRDGSCQKMPAPYATNLSASPDGKRVAEACTDRRVRIRNAETLEIERELRVHDEALTDVAWHPTLNRLATASKDYTVRIWNLDNAEMIQEFGLFFDAPSSLEWSPDGKNLAIKTKPTNLSIFTLKAGNPDSR